MSEIQLFLPGVLLSLSAVMLALMCPGPNILAVIGTSMSVGREQGIALQMTNPKAALATLAIVSIGVHADAPVWVGASIVAGATERYRKFNCGAGRPGTSS